MSAYVPLRTRMLTSSDIAYVHLGRAPHNATKPYVIMEGISGTPHHHLGTAAVTAEEVYQLTVVADTTSSRDTVKEAVRNTLDGYRGEVGSVRIQQIALEAPVDDIEALDGGRQSGEYTSRIDARVFYERAEPTG